MNIYEIFNMSEEEIYEKFILIAKEQQIEYEFTGSYLWIKGDCKICFTSHVDTVDFNSNSKIIVEQNSIITAYRNNKRCILGADDRAGVFLIYELFISHQINNIMLFSGEELGGIGSQLLVESIPDFSSIDLFIALDAAFHNRFIYYGNSNEYIGLFEFIESFGFKNDGHGIFTDISILCKTKPGVNLSVGYVNQHTCYEYLDLDSLYLTKKKIERILKSKLPIFIRRNYYESKKF